MSERIAVGYGNTADIYEWEEQDVVKLFKPKFAGDAEREFHIAQQVVRTGLRVPKAKSLVKLEDRSGIIYERIHGLELYVVMSQQVEYTKKWGQVFAEIHRDVHNHAVPSLPSAREELYHHISNCASLSLALRSKVLAVFDTLADDTVLCHGDFHPKNIIMTADGPVIIDWMNGRSFHPLADVALSSVILQVAPRLPAWVNDFHDSYVKTYLELSGFDEASLARWQIPMAAARLCENHADERARILMLIEEA